MTYGTTIKQAREAKSMTQEQLAEALDISRQAVSKWEADLPRPARGKLSRLSQVLNFPPETWAAIDAETAEASRPKDASRPWKFTAAASALLCPALGISLAAARPSGPKPPLDEGRESPPAMPDRRSPAA